MKKVRKYLADKLISLALKIDPNNVNVMQFYQTRMIDCILNGESHIKISMVDVTERYPKPKI